jgi:outer membrane protein OmpA-like peptidoglycan-associated protein
VTNQHGEDSVGLFPDGDAVLGYDKNGEAAELKGTDLTFGLELGADIFLSDHLAFNLGARYHLMPGNEVDNVGYSSLWGPDQVDANTAMVEGLVGLTWWFGGADSDHDGIPNKQDACPKQAEDMDGFNDLDGCPDIDNDRDGILDANDRCPNQPEDMDGYQDTDGCPEADNDSDGVIDGQDQCPEEAEDFDGFEDEDGCPEWDNDQDGVLDSDDRCPGTEPGAQVDEFGCAITPVIPEPVVPVKPVALPPADILEGVNFASGSSDLLPESIDVLLELAFTLQENPERRIEVRGHTDATGNAALNLDLSQRRAQSVRASLIDMGVAPGRITAVGYGQDFPIADNGTRAGRAKNRRVEIYNLP